MPVTAWFLHSMCDIDFDEPVGSNARRQQEAAAEIWLYFIRATEGMSILPKNLTFY